MLPVQVRGFRRTLRTLGQRGLGFRFLFGVQGLYLGVNGLRRLRGQGFGLRR